MPRPSTLCRMATLVFTAFTTPNAAHAQSQIDPAIVERMVDAMSPEIRQEFSGLQYEYEAAFKIVE